MSILEIQQMPTCINNAHESLTRAFYIVIAVKDYLRRGVPAEVLLELIEQMEARNETPPFLVAPSSDQCFKWLHNTFPEGDFAKDTKRLDHFDKPFAEGDEIRQTFSQDVWTFRGKRYANVREVLDAAIQATAVQP